MSSSETKSPAFALAYGIVSYILILIPMAGFAAFEFYEATFTWSLLLYLVASGVGLTAIKLAPVWACAALGNDPANASSPARRRWRDFAWGVAGFWTGMIWVYLVADAVIKLRYGYHFNGLVFNLLTTRGGFASMGIDRASVVSATILIVAVFAFHIVLALRFPRASWSTRLAQRLANRPLLAPALVAIPIFSLTVALISTGIAEFYCHLPVLNAIEAYPLNVGVSMNTFMTSMGFDRPKRDPSRDAIIISHSDLRYPQNPIVRRSERPRYNILWLCAESLRGDLLSPERMPNAWQMAEKHGVRFANHFSGGNGTRPAMFSMFYGLYGSAWGAFLDHNRGPLFIDWLREDNYQFLAQTSARFTYPEFDRTIFSALRQDELVEQDNKFPWRRDELITQRLLDFIKNRDTTRPFFGFMFFESTHAPYTFPPDKALFQPVLDVLSYATVSEKDREKLYNRAANAAHHVDKQLGKIFDFLQKNDLMDNTIIVVTGDHGEEFYDHGRLGHNSAFVTEQIHPPLILHLPGVKPAVVNDMTHHCDIVPTLAPFLGVENPPADYSVGGNLLDSAYQRTHFIVCGWETAVFVNRDGKLMLPLNPKSTYVRHRLHTFDDKVDPDVEGFYERNVRAIFQAQLEMQRCLGK